jgi:hypothetical protein
MLLRLTWVAAATRVSVHLGGGLFAELDTLVGLESVKESVRRMVAEIKANQRRRVLGPPTQERARAASCSALAATAAG